MYKVCEYIFCLPSNWQHDAERGEGERELERYSCNEKYVYRCMFLYVYSLPGTCTCTCSYMYMYTPNIIYGNGMDIQPTCSIATEKNKDNFLYTHCFLTTTYMYMYIHTLDKCFTSGFCSRGGKCLAQYSRGEGYST